MTYKSILTVLTVIASLVAVLVVLDYTERTREERLARLEGSTFGVVKTIEENDNLQQNADGADVVVDSYTIEFEYTVDGVVHYGKDNLEGSEDYGSFVRDIIDSNFELEIAVRYDPDNPTTSLIVPPARSDEN